MPTPKSSTNSSSCSPLQATFDDRFDKIDDRLAKQEGRLETVADRLLALEKKVSGIDRRLNARGTKGPKRLRT
jgi:hypothetical protein